MVIKKVKANVNPHVFVDVFSMFCLFTKGVTCEGINDMMFACLDLTGVDSHNDYHMGVKIYRAESNHGN